VVVVVVRPAAAVPLTPAHLGTDFACRELGRVDVPVSSVQRASRHVLVVGLAAAPQPTSVLVVVVVADLTANLSRRG
jgi:hypothetical protein